MNITAFGLNNKKLFLGVYVALIVFGNYFFIFISERNVAKYPYSSL